MKQLLFVGLGGFFGSIARYLASRLNATCSFHHIPLGTLIVNVAGSVLIGFLMSAFFHSDGVNNNLKLFLTVGFCGGFTTFSAFTNENFQLLQNGQYLTAFIYIFGSILLGILGVFAGYLLAKM